MTRPSRFLTLARRVAANSVVVLIGAAASSRPGAAQDTSHVDGCASQAVARECFERAMDAASAALGKGGSQPGPQLPAAIALLNETCTLGLADACYFSGRLMVTAIADTTAVESSRATRARALEMFRRGCDAKPPSGEACAGVGDSHAYPLSHPDLDSAALYYRRGCRAESPTACAREAALLRIRPEYGRAWFAAAGEQSATACRDGSQEACVVQAAALDTALAVVPENQRQSTRYRRSRDSLVAWYRGLCQRGERQVAACGRLGTVFEYGKFGLRARPDSARHYYWLGCRGQGTGTGRAGWIGDGEACVRLAGTLRNGASAARDSALFFYQAGCALYTADACVRLAREIRRADLTGARFPEAMEHSQNACEWQNGEGCSEAAEMLLAFGKDTVAFNEAVRLFQRACDLGSGRGCLNLARLPQNASALTARLRFSRRACELGEGGGCTVLGTLLQAEFGDSSGPGRLYARACELGDAEGCAYALGRARNEGDRVQEGLAMARLCGADSAYCKRKGDPTWRNP